MSESVHEQPWNVEAADGTDENAPCSVRIMRAQDVDAVTSLDARQTGQARRSYYEDKIERCLQEPRINTSLLAEKDGAPVGFLIGRLFFGEFGIPATRAVLDTLGVHPGFRGQGIATALLAQYRRNLSALRVEAIDTLVDWDRFDVLAFFKSAGFRPSRDVDLVWDVAGYPFTARNRIADVRPAEESDLEAIAAVDQEVLGEDRINYLSDKLGACRTKPDRNRFLVAEVGGELAGYLMTGLYQGEFGIRATRGVIDTLGVRERFQHQGIGSSMLQSLLGWLEERGVTQMETLCHWNDWELLRFFEYAGFRPSSRINLECRFQ